MKAWTFVAALLLVLVGAADRADAGTVYCTPHFKPKGCIERPKSVKKAPPAKKQPVRPRPAEAAVGQGGGPRPVDRKRAIAYVEAQAEATPPVTKFRGLCEAFVEAAYGTYGMYADAKAALKALQPTIHRGDPKKAPAGTLMYFKADRSNNFHGHVGISLGNGRMVSALSRITIEKATTRYWKSLYAGWAEAPVDWPGILQEGTTGTAVSISGPSNVVALSGEVSVSVRAPGAAGVRIDAFYSDNPGAGFEPVWHLIGKAAPSNGGWALPLSTTRIPDQGDVSSGTVLVRATALDGAGKLTPDSDSRRYVINNSMGPLPTPTPPPGPRQETTGTATGTRPDYATADGQAGPPLPAGQTVDVACRVEGASAPDGTTWWYRITTPPWDGFYAAASAFYNDGRTSGPMEGSPAVDEAVIRC